MSLLPQTMLPQSAPIGTVNADGSVTAEQNWWLLWYNIVQNSIGGGIPASAIELLESTDIDAYTSGLVTARTVGNALYAQTGAERACGSQPLWYQYPPGHVLRYGANISPGVTDMTAAIQAALNQSQQPTGAPVYLPPQTYRITASLTASATFSMIGANRYNTIIEWASTTMTALVIASDIAFIVSGLLFSAPAGCTAGGAISITGSTAANTFSRITDCVFQLGCVQINCISAAQFYISDNYFTGYVYAGIIVQNQYNVDDGDSTLIGNIFSNGSAGSAGVAQASSGGLRIFNNKFNGGDYGYLMDLASGAVTSVLVIVGNSFENQNIANVAFNSKGGGGAFAFVQIVGNEFALAPTNIEFIYTTACFASATIVGNTIGCGNGASALNGIVIDYVSELTIDGNILTVENGSPTGITIDAHSSGTIGVNTFGGGFSANIANGSPSAFLQAMTPVAPSTGWGTPTAGAVVNNFPGSGATTAQCGEVLTELILQLQAAGLLTT